MNLIKKKILLCFSPWLFVTPIKAADELSKEEVKKVQDAGIKSFLKDFKHAKLKELGIEGVFHFDEGLTYK